MKILIVVLFLGVLVSLGSAMKYLMQDRGRTDRMAWALTWRVGLSILLFLPWIGWARVAWPGSRVQWGHLAVTGVLMHAGYLGGVWTAVKFGMGSGLSALIVGLQPVLTGLWLTAREFEAS